MDASRTFHIEQLAVTQHNREVDAVKSIAKNITKANAQTSIYTFDYLDELAENNGELADSGLVRLTNFLTQFEYYRTVATVAMADIRDKEIAREALRSLSAAVAAATAVRAAVEAGTDPKNFLGIEKTAEKARNTNNEFQMFALRKLSPNGPPLKETQGPRTAAVDES